MYDFCKLYTGASLDGARKLNSGRTDVAINVSGVFLLVVPANNSGLEVYIMPKNSKPVGFVTLMILSSPSSNFYGTRLHLLIKLLTLCLVITHESCILISTFIMVTAFKKLSSPPIVSCAFHFINMATSFSQ